MHMPIQTINAETALMLENHPNTVDALAEAIEPIELEQKHKGFLSPPM